MEVTTATISERINCSLTHSLILPLTRIIVPHVKLIIQSIPSQSLFYFHVEPGLLLPIHYSKFIEHQVHYSQVLLDCIYLKLFISIEGIPSLFDPLSSHSIMTTTILSSPCRYFLWSSWLLIELFFEFIEDLNCILLKSFISIEAIGCQDEVPTSKSFITLYIW